VGVADVAVVNDEVSIQAKPGFSGKTSVTITLKNDEEISQIVADVLVIPLPVSKPVVKEIADEKTRITWVKSPNAIGYEVTQGDVVLCTTKITNCLLNRSIPVNPPIEIQALGKDETKSEIREAAYVGIPEIALVVNFDTARYNIDAEDRALIKAFARDVVKYGYKEIDITGHTDSRGGIDNNVLSNNRAKAARDYLLKLLPDLKVTVNGFADAISVASNATVEGRAENRRSEFRVVK
jgi:outer membrane protein OmpA-like peptidoglycan-associated protein